jgi:hypothetical protein
MVRLAQQATIMQLRIPIIILCLTAVALCLAPSVHAADALSRLTHGDQYALALGTIVSASDASVRFEVGTIISGKALPPVINVQVPGPFMEAAPYTKLEPGDHAVLSLDQEADQYTVAWGCFKVSSLDITTLEVIEGPLSQGDLAALQWYINSQGTENDFYFVGTNAYVRHPDGTSTQLYPPPPEPDVEPHANAVQSPIGDAESSSGLSKGPGSDKKAASKTTTIPQISQDEKALAPQWVYAIIAVGFVLAGYFTYRIIKTKPSD